MGKASSSKKVARAASTGGGRTSRGRRPVGYYTFLTVVAVLGTLVAVMSRQDLAPAGAEPPTTKDHWHMAYGLYVCQAFVPNLEDKGADRLGIHTHGDGLIHVHPFSKASSGRNATVGKFADQVGLELSTTELGIPGQKKRKNGDKCDGKAGEVKAVLWDGPADEEGRFVGGDPSEIPITENGIVTLAFVPEGTKVEDIPKPGSVGELSNPVDLRDPAAPPPAGEGGEGGEGSTSSTAPGESSSTSEAPATTSAP